MNEGFEGTGFENTGWTAFSTSDPDDAGSPLVGTQSLRCSGVSSFIQRSFAPSSEFFGYFQVRWAALAPYKFVVDWLDSGSTSISRVVTDGFPNRLQIVHGTVSVSGTTALATGVTYHVWVEWSRGTGSDGKMNLFVSTNGVKSASPEASITNGTGNSAVDKFDVGPFDASGSTDVIYDHILLDDAAIGSNPGGNAPPSISSIPNQITPESTALGPIDFTVGDADTNASSLVVFGVSSNTNVVSNSDIVFGGNDSNRTVTITPVANVSGLTTITLTVSDGFTSNSTSFTLVVGNVNVPPSISAIDNKTTVEGTPTSEIPFAISDAETAAASLTITGESSNTALVPNANIVFGGSASNRTVTITPAAGQTGTTIITVFVSDSQSTNSTNFNLTVTPAAPVNTPPTISGIGNQTTSQDTPVGPINFTVGDAETAAGSLTVTGISSNPSLVPNAAISLGGTGAGRNVTLTPGSGLSGITTITLTVSDGVLTASTNFTLTVMPPGGGSSGFSFAEGFEGTGYENTGWSEVGTPDPDYTNTVLRETQSLNLSGGEIVSRTYATTNLNLYIRGNWSQWVPYINLIYLEEAESDPAGSLYSDFNRLAISHGSDSAVGTTIIDLNTTYHIWLEWTSSTGANGTMKLYVSTTAIKPALPEATLSLGTGTDIKMLYFGSHAPDFNVTYDSLFLDDEPIPSNPSVNTTPTITEIADQTIDEDSPTTAVSFTVNDLETSPSSLNVAGNSSNPLLVPNANIVFGGSSSNRTVTVTPAADQFGTATITITVSDGVLTTNATFLFTVNSVNDAPLVGLPLGTTNYVENSTPILIDPSATLTDVDSPDFWPGKLTANFLTNGSPDDRLVVRHEGAGPGQIGVSGTGITYEGNAIATLTEGGNRGEPLVISFDNTATLQAAQAVLRNITFENISETPSTLPRTIQVVAEDGRGGTSLPASVTINVIGVSDDPTLTWASPAPIVYGNALGVDQLNANANVPGSFSYSPTAGTVLNVGSNQNLSVMFTPTDTTNYNTIGMTVTLTVTPAVLLVTADDKTKVYGDALPALTASYSGLVNGDLGPAILPTLTTSALVTSPVGTYAIVASDAADPNYTISYAAGTLTVSPAGPITLGVVGVTPVGEVNLRVTSDPGQRVRIQWTIDLTSWTDLVTLVNTIGTFEYIDVTAVGQPYRFYRALLAPE